jgi:hypothetical protein
MRWRGAALALLLLGSGCYKATFIRDPTVVRGLEYDEWVGFFVFGLVNEQSIDVYRFCPDGQVAQVQTGGNLGTTLVSALTLGIYTPRKVYVTCAAPGSVRFLERDEQGRLVAIAAVRP